MHHSHTHCQAAQAHATTKAWQRVCLSNRTNKTTDKLVDEKEHRSDNSVLPQLAVTCKIETECSYQTFVQVDPEVLRNCQLRQHANRCPYKIIR